MSKISRRIGPIGNIGKCGFQLSSFMRIAYRLRGPAVRFLQWLLPCRESEMCLGMALGVVSNSDPLSTKVVVQCALETCLLSGVLPLIEEK